MQQTSTFYDAETRGCDGYYVYKNRSCVEARGIAQIPLANLEWLLSLRNGKFFDLQNKMQSKGILK